MGLEPAIWDDGVEWDADGLETYDSKMGFVFGPYAIERAAQRIHSLAAMRHPSNWIDICSFSMTQNPYAGQSKTFYAEVTQNVDIGLFLK